MSLAGLPGGQYRPLSADDVVKIHEASLSILERTGMTYKSGLEGLLDILEEAGAAVDRVQHRITFPRELVLAQIAKAPQRVTLFSRDGKNDLALQDDKVYLGTGGAAVRVLDLETGEARTATLRDLHQFGRLADKLNNIHFFLRPCIPSDLSESVYDVNVMYACLQATTKHIMVGVTGIKGLKDVIELAAMVAGGTEKLQEKPFISIVSSFAISPLKLNTLSTQIMQEACRHRIPLALSGAPKTGSTGPMTMAGTIALAHAEQLAGITICQLTAPGAPVLYSGLPGTANPRTMNVQTAAIESGIMNAAAHQMARYVNIPNYGTAGMTESKIPDAQAGWESASTILLTVMAGVNYIHHASGMLESSLTASFEQYVINDEIIGRSCKVLKGIKVDADHLATEVIDAVGPGGNFITATHTLDHLRQELYLGNGVTDTDVRQIWLEKGGQDAWARAGKIVRKLLAGEQQPAIPVKIDRDVRKRFDIRLEQT